MNIDASIWLGGGTKTKAYRLPASHNPDLCVLRFGEPGGTGAIIYLPSLAAVAGLHAILGDFLRSGQDINRTLTDPLLQIAQPETQPEESL